jgi:D-amino-acid dehydrogenase
MSKVVVIGAGITGITTAYSLAKRGYKVTVIEAEPYAAMITSYANGGQLSVSNSEVWTTWGNIVKAAKWMIKKDAPLLVNPWPSRRKVSWATEFLANTVFMQYETNTVKTIQLGLQAREHYFAIAEQECIDFDLYKRGILHFYKDAAYYAAAVKSCDLYQTNGVDRKPISIQEMATIEPTLENNKSIIGATYTSGDATGDIHKFCIELASVLEHKYAVKFYYNTRVEQIDKVHEIIAIQTYGHNNNVKTIVADHVVICAGVASADLAYMLNDRVQVYPIKGYSLTIPLLTKAAQEAAPEVSLLDDEAKIVTSRLGKDRFRIAGTAELADYNLDIRKSRIDPLINWVRKNFPQIPTEHCIPWAGLRPMTPSMLPIVRQSNTSHCWFNTGHGHLGWTLSAATAEIIADQIDSNPNDNNL